MRAFKSFIVTTLVLGGSLCGCAEAPEDVDTEEVLDAVGSRDTYPSAPEVPAGATAVPYRPFEELVQQFHTHSGLDSRERLVISSQEQWAPLRRRLGEVNPPSVALPDPDFRQEQLIVAAMGSQPTSGYSIQITGVWRSEGSLYVSVQEVSPWGCLNAQEVTRPVDAVLIPRSTEPVLFVALPTVFPCGPR